MDPDVLYTVDPSEFVATRDGLVRELRAAGDKDGAREVKLLRRPAVPIWAFNQVARTDSSLTRRAAETAATARQVQIDVMNGTDPAALRTALAERRRAMEHVVAKAAAIIDHSGRSSASYERELSETLNTIVSNEQFAKQLQTGRLGNIPTSSDTAAEFLAGLPEPTPSSRNRAASSRTPETSHEGVAAAKRDIEEAKRRVRRADAAYREAVLVRDRAQRALDDAQRGVETSEHEQKAARADLERRS